MNNNITINKDLIELKKYSIEMAIQYFACDVTDTLIEFKQLMELVNQIFDYLTQDMLNNAICNVNNVLTTEQRHKILKKQFGAKENEIQKPLVNKVNKLKTISASAANEWCKFLKETSKTYHSNKKKGKV